MDDVECKNMGGRKLQVITASYNVNIALVFLLARLDQPPVRMCRAYHSYRFP